MIPQAATSRLASALLALGLAAGASASLAVCPDPDDPACNAPLGWQRCAAPMQSPLPRPDMAVRAAAELTIDAGSASYRDEQRIELADGFVMNRADQRLTGRAARYDRGSGEVIAEGAVDYTESGLALSGARLTYNFDDGAGRAEEVSYALTAQHLRGTATAAEWRADGAARMETVTYTSCDPGDDGWVLSARSITLDRESGWGEARDAVVRIKGVPVLWTPWLPFPLDDRRTSGLLVPRIGHSADNGLDVALPWYWNIAANRDATLTPRILTERGLQLSGEFRYLYRHDGNPYDQRGEVELAVLPGDRIYDDDRAAFSLRHDGRPAPGWEVGVNAAWVSDDDYLSDLGDSLTGISPTHLEREARVAWQDERWSLRAFARYLQALDGTRPYQAMPQVELAMAPLARGPLRAGLRAEAVRFARADLPGGLADVTGSRYDAEPWVGLAWRRPWGYFEPRVALRHTAWSLDQAQAGTDLTPTRTVPIVSLDAGLFFERRLDSGMLQTLEPRARFLHVARRDQDGLIMDRSGNDTVFDSIRPQFGFDELFTDNRYTGADRVGDTSQLSIGITSRWMDADDGRERLRLDVGQAFYFRDRVENLPGEPRGTAEMSPLVAELHGRIGRGLGIDAALHYDGDAERTDLGAVALSYRPGRDRFARAAYRRNRGALEQADFAIDWPLGGPWRFLGRYNYSLRADTRLETVAGLEYKSCCWTARALLREHVRDTLTPRERDLSLHVQVELAGLGKIGQRVDTLLGTRIPHPHEVD